MNGLNVQEYFKELGNDLDKEWQILNYNEDDFPEIAANALARRNISQQLSYTDILNYIALQPHLDILQTETNFSDLQLTLFKNSRFYIAALYWMDGTTSIHEHAFCGAFTLLHGKSINTEYQFIEKKRINGQFYIGDLKVKKSSILTRGDVRKITAGSQLIHAVFHLDSPSVSLIIRNHGCMDKQPQLSYFGPHIAVQNLHKNLMLMKKIQCIKLTLNHLYVEGYSLLLNAVIQSNLHELYHLFDIINLFGLEKPHIQEISQRILNKPYGAELLKSLTQKYHLRCLATFRRFLTDEHQRLFLALLRNTPGKQLIIQNFYELLQTNDQQILGNTMVGFIEKTSHINGVGYKNCEHLELIANYLVTAETDEKISAKINQLGESATLFYQCLRHSFVFNHWFINQIETTLEVTV